MSLPRLSNIIVYPIKSTSGVRQSRSWVEKQGLAFDRRFMLATADGKMVTARVYPELVSVNAVIVADGLIVSADDRPALTLNFDEFVPDLHTVTVWSDTFEAHRTTPQADQWFSDLLGQEVYLLFTGRVSKRIRPKLGHAVSFADGYPLLLIGEASLNELNERSSEIHQMAQFRPNLVVKTTEAFVEDRWKTVQIGDVLFDVVKPCERCILTTVDVDKAAFKPSKEPLKTLSQFRLSAKGGVFFGQNLVAKNEGMIQEGDEVKVLEWQTPEPYQDLQQKPLTLTCEDTYPLTHDMMSFDFSLPENTNWSYQAGQHVAIEVMIDGERHRRHYSLSGEPDLNHGVQITVKKQDDGLVSRYLHEHFSPGQSIKVWPPQGEFILPKSVTKPLLFLSAGSGITPMMPMLFQLFEQGYSSPVHFIHQCRDEQDMVWRNRLALLEQVWPSLTVEYILSQPSSSWRGQHGRLALAHLSGIPAIDEYGVYLCGPAGFRQVSRRFLEALGVRDIQEEQFGYQAQQAPLKEFELTCEGKRYTIDNQTSLLAQAEKMGLPIASSCRAGFCGSCKVKLKSGKVIQPDSLLGLTTLQRLQGFVLACSCIADSDIEIER
ncbi:MULTISPECIES: MOSC N-terminal beta barrel domain-containing protein [unclassified Vibrio]|uniref:MOSC N-terminal beta barrel domain-containing protein n=1 Tax=Vibrio sp. HB236076 TaxID=3232307 RepID=A0AB39HIY4_9VIBR|nr:MOSC N-terminal beta barrel domain-containing protein [Vibrio sp. HB161653]MDP5252651.1 MOSC domain-containing protein [Vibrio sp. HB161653]